MVGGASGLPGWPPFCGPDSQCSGGVGYVPQLPHPGAYLTASLRAGGDSSSRPVKVEVQTTHRPLPVWVEVRHPGFSAVVGRNGAVIFKMFSVWLGCPFPGPLHTHWLWLVVLLAFLLADFSSSTSGIIKCTHTHTHPHPHPYTYTPTYMHTYNTHTHTHTCTCPTHPHTHMHTHTYTPTHIYAYTQ